MSLIRVREKNQITLPRDVVNHFHIQASSQMEYKILPDGIFIRPVQMVQKEDKLAKLRRLAQSVPSAYGIAGSAGSAADAAAQTDAYINALRDEWIK